MKRYSKQYWSTNPLTLYLLNTKSQENNRPLLMTLAVQALARQARQCTLQVIGSTGPGLRQAQQCTLQEIGSTGPGETGTTMYTTGDWQYRPWRDRHDNVHYRWYGNIIIPIQRGEHYKKGATLSEALIHFNTQE